jgi:hypothetical protein
VILCLGLVGALAALTRAQRWAARQKHQSESAPPPQSLPTTESAASTPAILNTEQNGFEVSAITLESTPGTTRVYATGTLKNKTDRKRFGVKIELELLDAAEQNAGTATDYQAVMEPGAEWRYQALVVASKATSARIASIKEDQ